MPKNLDKNSTEGSIVGIAERLVRAQMAAGLKRPEAEQALASRMGLGRYSLENLRRGRIKNVETIGYKLRAALIGEFERQIQALQHELMVARLVDRPIDFDEVEALLDRARQALGESKILE